MSAYLEPTRFVRDLKKQIEDGHGIVPFIGAGLSLASGIPTTGEYKGYLFHCLKLMLADPEQPDGMRWDPRRSKWPPIPKPRSPEGDASTDAAKHEWMTDTIGQVAASDEGDLTPLQRARWQAVGDLADWRSTLSLLSRATIENEKITLGAPDDSVRDRFFKQITKGRRPNLGHYMLAHLADPLRMQTLLTTNFDSLLEDAFGELGVPIEVFDVHQRAQLPDPSLVLAQRSLVKLHGAKYGLRVDETLSEEPSDADRRAFRRYFKTAGQRKSRRHLLVMGFSGEDDRIISLIRDGLEHRAIGCVYWVCYRNDEIEKIESKLKDYRNKLRITRHHDPGLLLLESYQRICVSLPPAGAHYSFLSDVPAEPYRVSKRARCREDFDNCLANLKESMRTTLEGEETGKVPRIVVAQGPRGLSSVAATLFEELRDSHHCVWLGLDDYYEPTDFFVSLIQSVAGRLGIRSTTPPTAVFDTSTDESKKSSADKCKEELSHYLSRSSGPIIAFLHARDGFGISAGADDDEWDETPIENLCFLLNTIAQRGIVFVLLLLDKHFNAVTKSLGPENISHCTLTGGCCLPFTEDMVINRIKKWLATPANGGKEQNDRRLRFVYALTLFRHSRHYASLYSWALIKAPKQLSAPKMVPVPPAKPDEDNDLARSRMGDTWMSRLEKARAIRMKPGGRVWMHQGVKKSLRHWLESEDGPKLSHETAPLDIAWECHQGIADWYVKLFRSSNDPLAALESICHRLRTIDRSEKIGNAELRQHVRETALIEAISTLRLARDRILECGYFSACQDLIKVIEGKAKESSAQNGSRPKVSKKPNAFQLKAMELQSVCTELRRDFSAAMADFQKAMKIHEAGKAVRTTTSNLLSYPDSALLDLHLRAEYLTGLRCYKDADDAYLDLFAQLGLEGFEQILSGPSVARARLSGRRWARRVPRGSEAKMEMAVEALRGYMFLHMLTAQAEQLSGTQQKEIHELRVAETLYTMATEIMRYIENPPFLQQENAHIRTHYAAVLSNLARPLEAHRRLNEAASYLFKSEQRYDPIPWAVLELRRAETYLDHVTRAYLKKRPLGMLIAWLDSAHVSLARARERLEGHREDIWWWTWLHELEVTVCVQLSSIIGLNTTACLESLDGNDLAIVCSGCSGPFERLLELLDEGTRANNRLDILRLARLGRLCCEFLDTHASVVDLAAKDLRLRSSQIREALQTALQASRTRTTPPDQRIMDYAEATVLLLEEKCQAMDRCLAPQV